MSITGYARLLLQTHDVPSGALIYVLDRVGNNTRFLHRKTNKIYTAAIGERSLLWFPPATTILMLLSDHTPVGIMWQRDKGESWYSVVNMQFGIKVEEQVPVFKDGKKQKAKRTVKYNRSVRIRARTFDQAAYFLFFATLGGKLCRKRIDGRFDHLLWDNLEQRFKVEVRDA